MLLVVTDIFGETPWTDALVESYQTRQGQEALVVSPYSERIIGLNKADNKKVASNECNPLDQEPKEQAFKNEAAKNQALKNQALKNQALIISPSNEQTLSESQAYERFIEAGGINAYIEKLSAFVASAELSTAKLNAIGFSAGGAALWAISQSVLVKRIHYAELYYPGQIRHFLEVTPAFPCEITFPNKESHFDLSKVFKQLEGKPMVTINRSKLGHGFLNPLSENYHPATSKTFLTEHMVNFGQGYCLTTE